MNNIPIKELSNAAKLLMTNDDDDFNAVFKNWKNSIAASTSSVAPTTKKYNTQKVVKLQALARRFLAKRESQIKKVTTYHATYYVGSARWSGSSKVSTGHMGALFDILSSNPLRSTSIKSVKLLGSDFSVVKSYNGKNVTGRANGVGFHILFEIEHRGKRHTVKLYNSGAAVYMGGYPQSVYVKPGTGSVIYDVPSHVLGIALRSVGIDDVSERPPLKSFVMQRSLRTRIKASVGEHLRQTATTFTEDILSEGGAQSVYNFTLGKYFVRLYITGVVQVGNIQSAADVSEAIRTVETYLTSIPAQYVGVIPKKFRNFFPKEISKKNKTTCPSHRCPNPYTFQGKCPAAYPVLAPNPQGKPCCYKRPSETMKTTLRKSYANAGRNIPSNMERYLGAYKSGTTKSFPKFTMTPKGLLINQRRANHPTVSLNSLRNLGRNMNVNQAILKGRSKKKIINAISASARSKGMLKNVQTHVNLNSNKFRPFAKFGTRQECGTMTSDKITELALKHYGIRVSGTKKDMCEQLKEHIRKNPLTRAASSSSSSNMSNFAKNIEANMKKKSPPSSRVSSNKKSPPPSRVSSSSSNSNMSNFAKNIEANMKKKSPSPKKLNKMANAHVEKM